MKKRIPLLILLAVILVASVWSIAVGGVDDPLASLSYLNGTFAKTAEQKIDQRLEESDRQLMDQISTTGSTIQTVSTWTETRLKANDVLSGTTGTNVMLLAGSVQIVYTGSAVIDVTAGSTVSSGSNMTVQHRYMVAEDTDAQFVVTSKTAVVDYLGQYTLLYSNAVDYNAMASALKSLNLFRGSDTGYGSGFDLEVTPTRLQALIMLIRLLGEEDAALASAGTSPFKDVANGSYGSYYVGYAYEMGYTNGCSPTRFQPNDPINVYQYTEFVLRAMGYSSTANTNVSDALLRAMNAGVLSSGEVSMLEKDPFRRAELVYLSFYSLSADLPNGTQTLADTLSQKRVFTASAWRSAQRMVSSQRL